MVGLRSGKRRRLFGCIHCDNVFGREVKGNLSVKVRAKDLKFYSPGTAWKRVLAKPP
jgi:hypothetical protein